MGDREGEAVQTIRVDLPGTEPSGYPVHFGDGLLSRLAEFLPRRGRTAVVTDERVQRHWGSTWVPAVDGDVLEVVLPEGESHKNVASVERVWSALNDANFTRQDVVVNIGGGVVGDLGGFAASTYLRGIAFVQVPTTLLAMVDASVGGKLGIDFGGGKNRVGSFAQPEAVIADLSTLSTLDPRQLRSGCAEVIKHGLISDAEFFDSFDPSAVLTAHARGEVHPDVRRWVQRSCEIKAGVVAADELERGERRILNFGHTVGHAVESLSWETDDPWLHGEAIGVGMLVAAEISGEVAGLDASVISRLRDRLLACGLPVELPSSISDAALMFQLASDKKRRDGAVEWTLLPRIGAASHGHRIETPCLERALNSVRESA